jgi:DNA-binding beta-propeller fold protein YncE
MKQTITIPYVGIFFLAIVLLLLPAASVLASSPWQWQMSLSSNTPGDAMYMPAAVSFDPASQRYYVVDSGKNRLVSFNRKGELLKAFSADNRLLAPFDMVRLDNGQLWVVEKGRNSLTLIDIGAKKVTPNTLRDGGHLVFPDRIALSGGKLYVLNRADGTVLRLNDDLTVAQRFGCADCPGVVVDFAVDNGSVWTLENTSKNIHHYGADGSLSETIPLGDRVNFPVSLGLGPSDSLIYVLDRHQDQVVVFGRDGRFQYSFFGLGQGQEQLYFPRQLRFDPWGQLCVVDEGNGRVEVFRR